MPNGTDGNYAGNSGGDEPNFFTLFRRHWDAGTGLEYHAPHAVKRDGRFIYKTFADAYAKASRSAPDLKTVEAWKAGRRRPQEESKSAILAVFFPAPRDAAAQAACAAMEAAWQRLPRSAPAAVAEDATPALTGWTFDDPETLMKGLAELVLHQPVLDNDLPGAFRLRATLALDSNVYTEAEDGHGYRVTLRDPIMALHCIGYHLDPATKLDSEHPHLKSIPHGWRVAGAERADGSDVTRQRELGLIIPHGDGKGRLTVVLKGGRHCVTVVPTDSEGQALPQAVPTEEKAAVLDMLFRARLGRDADGVTILARHGAARGAPT